MQHIVLTEYERLTRTEENRKLLSRLQRFDEKWAVLGRDSIFDWNDRRFVRAKNYVGVITVPGGTVEILPKVDKPGDDGKGRAQKNLVYMLSLTRKIVGEERDLAALSNQKMPLLEQLVAMFAERTLSELKRGIDHTYVTQEENLKRLKGKLLIGPHILHNCVHRERVFCRYDDFIPDTPINRVLKAGCRRLLSISKSSSAQKKLREIVFLLDEVTDIDIADHVFLNIHYTRNSERFKPLVSFCSLVLKGMSPTWSTGKDTSLSLLFPMEEIFEEFIARYIYHYADQLGLSRELIHVQAAGRGQWLLKREHDAGLTYRLKPDLVIDNVDGKPRIIVDTKWKHLLTDAENAKNGVSQADIYQLYAYAHRYECPDNILLFPLVGGVSRKAYVIQGPYCSHKIRVEFVNLNRDLRTDGQAFREEIKTVIAASKGPM